jgi:hypothetical protein
MLRSSIFLSRIHPEKVMQHGTFVIIHGTFNYKCTMEQHFFWMNSGKSAAM